MEMASLGNWNFTIPGDFQAKPGPICVWESAQGIPAYGTLEHMIFKVFYKLK